MINGSIKIIILGVYGVIMTVLFVLSALNGTQKTKMIDYLSASNERLSAALSSSTDTLSELSRRVDILEDVQRTKEAAQAAARADDTARRDAVQAAPVEWCAEELPAEIRAAFCKGDKHD